MEIPPPMIQVFITYYLDYIINHNFHFSLVTFLDDSRKSLKEKVARLRQERLIANTSGQDSQIFQHQISQLRRQMLMQTIEGLKRSLEDQSATLKQTCLEPVMTDRLP